MNQKIRVGIIGCGAISPQYLTNARNFPILEIASCSDLNPAAAQQKATEFGIAKVQTVAELLADPSIDAVLNLTIPKAHAAVTLAALNAGKHVYLEKPLSVTRKDAKAIMAKAKHKKLLVDCAPDTFLGAGLQTARAAIDDGHIGKPVAFTAFMMCPGHESWHPSPEFYYDIGGGPMLDMGPYYLTALLNLLGPVKRITGMASMAIRDRVITSQPKFGKKIPVKTPDHITGLMEFQQGTIGTIVTSFATRFSQYDGRNPITIFGTEGTLLVPDPNCFGGPVKLRKKDDADFRELPLVYSHDYGRAVGLADMAYSILRRKRPARAGAEQAMAVLDLMLGFLDSSASGKAFKPTVKYRRPKPMPRDLAFGVLDE